MAIVRDYSDLIAWQRAMDLVVAVYQVANSLPVDERYGLSLQMRRAAVSIPSNIAEGHGRDSTKEFLHYLSIARGSLCEVETQVLIAERLAYVSGDDRATVLEQTNEVGRLLRGLSRALSARLSSS